VVDDYPSVLEWITRRLQLEDLQVHAVSTGEDAVSVALREKPDLALIDYTLPGMNGVETAAAIRNSGLQIPWVLFSAAENEWAQVEARKLGASDVVWSPFDPCAVVREAIYREKVRRTAEWARLLGARKLARPGTTAGRAAWWVLVACEASEDLPTLQLWAPRAGASYTSLRDGFTRLGVQPLDARDFMRALRALARVDGRVEHIEGELTVADPRSSAALLVRAGLGDRTTQTVSFEHFLTHQRFIPTDHPLLHALRLLASQL
jgi:CheY-like chemotaxis protein